MFLGYIMQEDDGFGSFGEEGEEEEEGDEDVEEEEDDDEEEEDGKYASQLTLEAEHTTHPKLHYNYKNLQLANVFRI